MSSKSKNKIIELNNLRDVLKQYENGELNPLFTIAMKMNNSENNPIITDKNMNYKTKQLKKQ